MGGLDICCCIFLYLFSH